MDLKRSASQLLIWSLFLVSVTTVVAFSQGPTAELLEEGHSYSVPFDDGERLRYEINWKPLFLVPAFKAGEIAFSIQESHYQDKPAYTISAAVFSEGLLTSVAGLEVRDQFESNIDRGNFRSYRMLTQLRRNKRSRDLEVRFNYEKNIIHLVETNPGVTPLQQLRNEKTQGEIPGPIADILSVFYVARLRSLEPGDVYWINLADRGKVRRVQIHVQSQETVQTPLGSFQAVKVSTVGGLFSNGGDFRVWYSREEGRLPVQFEADVKFGKVYGQLIGLETPTLSRSVIEID